MGFLPVVPFKLDECILNGAMDAVKKIDKKYKKEVYSVQKGHDREKLLEMINEDSEGKLQKFCGNSLDFKRLSECIAGRILDYYTPERIGEEIRERLCRTSQPVWLDILQSSEEQAEPDTVTLVGLESMDWLPAKTEEQLEPYYEDDNTNKKNLPWDFKSWLESSQIIIPLYCIPGAEVDAIQRIARIFNLIPYIEKDAPPNIDKKKIARYALDPCEDPEFKKDWPRDITDTYRMSSTDWLGMIEGEKSQLFLNVLAGIDASNPIARTVSLLGEACHTDRPDLKVIMSVAVLEGLCGLERDEQITKNVQRCMGLLFPPLERGEIMNNIQKIQNLRNNLLHVREDKNNRNKKNAEEVGNGNDAVRLAVKCILRRAAISQCSEEYSGKNMIAILEMYLKGEDVGLKDILDGDVLKRALAQF